MIILNAIHGQGPIITQSSFYQLGGEYLRTEKFDIELTSVAVGASGADVTWDFSAVDFDHPSTIEDTLSCILPNGTPFYNEPSINYTTSNLCLRSDTDISSINDNTFFYYKLENDSLHFVGDWALNTGAEKWYYSFSDLRTDLIFPFSYNDSHTDLFQSSYLDVSGSDWHYQTGSIEVTVDGYGKLITPDGDTLLNTVRVKEIVTTVDSNFVSGINTFVSTKYYWYSDNQEGPTLQFNMHPNQANTIVNAYYLKRPAVSTSSTEYSAQTTFSVFPNPTSNAFNIVVEDGNTEELEVFIYNATGRLLKRMEHFRNTTLFVDEKNMPPGIYLVELRNSKRLLGRKRLVVQ